MLNAVHKADVLNGYMCVSVCVGS